MNRLDNTLTAINKDWSNKYETVDLICKNYYYDLNIQYLLCVIHMHRL